MTTEALTFETAVRFYVVQRGHSGLYHLKRGSQHDSPVTFCRDTDPRLQTSADSHSLAAFREKTSDPLCDECLAEAERYYRERFVRSPGRGFEEFLSAVRVQVYRLVAREYVGCRVKLPEIYVQHAGRRLVVEFGDDEGPLAKASLENVHKFQERVRTENEYPTFREIVDAVAHRLQSGRPSETA